MNKSIKTITGAFLLYADDCRLVVLKKGVGVCLYDNNLKLLWGKKNVFGSCYVYENMYYFSTSEKTIQIDKFGDIINEFQFRIIKQYEKFFIISHDINEVSLFIPENNEILWSKDIFISNIGLISNDTFFATVFDKFFNVKKSIFEFSLKDNSLIWEFPYEQLCSNNDKINSPTTFLGISNNLLWLQIPIGKIIGINVRSGELIYKTDLLKEFNFDGNAIDEFVYGDIHLDSAYGILRSISNRYYWELDLNTFKATIKKDFGDLSDSWRIRRSKFYEGDSNLYFIGARHGEAVNRAVGIFDTNKCEVTWYDEPLEERKFLFFTDVPQANSKQLVVVDSERTLRLYNKS